MFPPIPLSEKAEPGNSPDKPNSVFPAFAAIGLELRGARRGGQADLTPRVQKPWSQARVDLDAAKLNVLP